MSTGPKIPMKLREPRSPEPLPCVILAIDPGAVSGWAILLYGRVLFSGSLALGKCKDGEVTDVIVASVDTAHRRGLPLVIVREKWSAGGWGSHATIAGLGAAWGAWKAALVECRVPKSRILSVYTQTWRAAVLGMANSREMSTEGWKFQALKTAAFANCKPITSSDEAEAICIGLWAASAPETWHALPKRMRPSGAYEDAIREAQRVGAEWQARAMARRAAKLARLACGRV